MAELIAVGPIDPTGDFANQPELIEVCEYTNVSIEI